MLRAAPPELRGPADGLRIRLTFVLRRRGRESNTGIRERVEGKAEEMSNRKGIKRNHILRMRIR